MAIADQPAPTTALDVVTSLRSAYKNWMEAQNIPIHRGYFIDDVRTVGTGDLRPPLLARIVGQTNAAVC